MKPLSYFVVCGSQRADSKSARVAEILIRRIKHVCQVKEVFFCDLGKKPLPPWEEAEWQARPESYSAWRFHHTCLGASSGLIFVVPEWDGMAPPSIKNFLHHCSADIVGHKPCLLVGVSASTGGALPIAELRASSSKNNRICYIPEHLIIRNVDDFVNDTESLELMNRIDWTLRVLQEYARSMESLTRNSLLFDGRYAYGM